MEIHFRFSSLTATADIHKLRKAKAFCVYKSKNFLSVPGNTQKSQDIRKSLFCFPSANLICLPKLFRILFYPADRKGQLRSDNKQPSGGFLSHDFIHLLIILPIPPFHRFHQFWILAVFSCNYRLCYSAPFLPVTEWAR